MIKIFLRDLNKPYVPLPGGLRLQVLPDITFLPGCQKHQFAAFIEDRGILIVWADNPRQLLDRASGIEKSLMQVTWDNPFSQINEKKDEMVQVNEVETNSENSLEHNSFGKRKLMMSMPVTGAVTLLLTFGALGGGWRELAFQTAVDGNYVRFVLMLVAIPQIWLALFFFQALVGDMFQIFGPVSDV